MLRLATFLIAAAWLLTVAQPGTCLAQAKGETHEADAETPKGNAESPKAASESPAGEEGQAAGEESKAAEPHDEHGDHGGHAYDPNNLSEGNASSQLGAAQELRFDLAIATFVIFVLLLVILTKFAWAPIARGLDLREETIARQIEEARLASEKAAAQLQEYEARLAAATEEARQIVGQSRKDAEVAKDKILAEARELSQKERERAVADITAAKNQALAEIAQKSVSTAVSLAAKIIRREVKPQDHEALIGDALGQFSKLN